MERKTNATSLLRHPSLRRAKRAAIYAAMLGLAVWSFRSLDLHAVATSLHRLPWTTILLALGLALVQALCLATRFWAVFPSGSRPRWGLVMRAFGVGQLVNTYAPGRAGDVVRVMAIAKDERASARGERVSAGDAAGVTLADKGFDVVSLIALVALCGRSLLGHVSVSTTGAGVAVGAAACVVVVALVSLRRFAPRVLAKVRSTATEAVRAARGMLTPGRLAVGFVLAIAAWFSEATLMVVLASPLGVHLSLQQAIVGILVLNVGIALPVSVANLGAFEAATAIGLAPFGATMAQGVAVGLLHHATQVVAAIVFALVVWLRDRLARGAVGPSVPRAAVA